MNSSPSFELSPPVRSAMTSALEARCAIRAGEWNAHTSNVAPGYAQGNAVTLPEQLGIEDIAKPDFGGAVEIMLGEMLVFWACGVTPQAVVMEAKPDFCITPGPGRMLITDLRNSDLAVS